MKTREGGRESDGVEKGTESVKGKIELRGQSRRREGNVMEEEWGQKLREYEKLEVVEEERIKGKIVGGRMRTDPVKKGEIGGHTEKERMKIKKKNHGSG